MLKFQVASHSKKPKYNLKNKIKYKNPMDANNLKPPVVRVAAPSQSEPELEPQRWYRPVRHHECALASRARPRRRRGPGHAAEFRWPAAPQQQAQIQ